MVRLVDRKKGQSFNMTSGYAQGINQIQSMTYKFYHRSYKLQQVIFPHQSHHSRITKTGSPHQDHLILCYWLSWKVTTTTTTIQMYSETWFYRHNSQENSISLNTTSNLFIIIKKSIIQIKQQEKFKSNNDNIFTTGMIIMIIIT